MSRDKLPARTAVVMTALLSQITMRIVVSRNMPMTKTHTWLDEFQMVILYMNAIGVLFWVAVAYFQMMGIQRNKQCNLARLVVPFTSCCGTSKPHVNPIDNADMEDHADVQNTLKPAEPSERPAEILCGTFTSSCSPDGTTFEDSQGVSVTLGDEGSPEASLTEQDAARDYDIWGCGAARDSQDQDSILAVPLSMAALANEPDRNVPRQRRKKPSSDMANADCVQNSEPSSTDAVSIKQSMHSVGPRTARLMDYMARILVPIVIIVHGCVKWSQVDLVLMQWEDALGFTIG